MEEIAKEKMLELIPNEWVNVKQFIKEIKSYYFEKDGENLKIDEVEIEGRQYLIVINLKFHTIEFIDDLVDWESVYQYDRGINIEEWKREFKKLENEIQKYNMRLLYTGNGGNEDYLWYKVSCPVETFKKEDLQQVTILWDTYNENRRKIIENK